MNAAILDDIMNDDLDELDAEIIEVPELDPELRAAYKKFQDAAVNVQPLERVKFLYVKYIMARCGGNITHAANALGVSRRQIQRWVKNGFR